MRALLPRTEQLIRRRRVQTACATVALATAWGAAEARADFVPFDVEGYVDPASELINPYLFVHYINRNDSGAPRYEYLFALDDAPAGQRTDFRRTIDTGHSDSFTDPGWEANYTILALSDPTEDRVTISMEQGRAASEIAGSEPWIVFSPNLAATAEALRSRDETIIARVTRLPVEEFGNTTTLVDYEPAIDNGTAFVDVVPEPTSFLLVTLGGMFAMRRPRS